MRARRNWTDRLTYRSFSFSRDSRAQELRTLLSRSLVLSLFLVSFSRSAGWIDIRARMRLRASSTSFTWLPQERGPAESISHTDVSTSSTVAASFSHPSKVVLIVWAESGNAKRLNLWLTPLSAISRTDGRDVRGRVYACLHYSIGMDRHFVSIKLCRRILNTLLNSKCVIKSCGKGEFFS